MSEVVEIPTLHLPPLYPKQHQAVFSPMRYSVIEASTKSGKTVGCILWILTEAWTNGKDGRSYWWIAPTYPTAKIAFRRLRRMMLRLDNTKTLWHANDSEMFITLVNGALIWFKGADNPDSLYGEDVYGAVIDEATRCKDEAWHAVRSTLTATKGNVRIIGNVKGRKNWAYQLARKAEAGDSNMSYHKLTAWDAVEAGVLSHEEIEDAKSKLPDAVFRELYLAEPSDDGGNPFGITAIRNCIRPIGTNSPVVFGVDLAKSHDWTWIIGLDAQGAICLSERWQSDWQRTFDRLYTLIGSTQALIDSTGVGDPIVEALQRKLMNVEGYKFTLQSKQQLMEGLAGGIQQQKVSVLAGILQVEMESFEFEYTAHGVRYSAPEGLHDDGVCALALAYRKLTMSGQYLPFTVAVPQGKPEAKHDRLQVMFDRGWE